jgi:hypothetical protein
MTIQSTLVTGSATTIFTSSGNTATTAIFFMNNNGSARTLDLHIVLNGQSAAVTNKILKAISINGGDTYVVNTEKLVLSNGDTIQAVASAVDSIYATISSVSI